MKSHWDEQEAAHFPGDLGHRVYTSRLLGREPSLVLHGGGNTSVKILERNVVGEEEERLYVKGSGWDLETIEEEGFSPVRLQPMLALAKLESLSDPEMVNELRTHMTWATSPTPSVETILHAILPYKYVDHTHADAVVTITNTPEGTKRIRAVYGESVVVIPYTMPGFQLARLCARRFAAEAHEGTLGMVLMNHGIFSFGETARESYERMIELVSRAETYLVEHDAWELPTPPVKAPGEELRLALAELRRNVSSVAGFPVILAAHHDRRSVAFVQRDDLADISQQGPATPDHVLRTKRLPQLGRDVEAYASAYRAYFEEHSGDLRQPLTMLDPAPRVILDPELGMCTVARTARDADIVRDLYAHTMEIIQRSTLLSRYQALPTEDIFRVEYWDLEQAKLRSGGSPPMFCGEVALVTGAASGIGKACVQSLRSRGAAVMGLDIDPHIESPDHDPDYLGIQCDVTRARQVSNALEKCVRTFGGLDIMILNAGVFPASRRIGSLSTEEWRSVMDINLDANLMLMREAYPLLKLAPRRGRMVIIGSKNVPAPGPGAAAYSASKAALNQLARIAAMEWGEEGIRVNSLNPNAVFDTGIWTEEVLRSRASHYGMSVEDYKRKNILGVEIASRDVAELAAELCGPLFAKTTGSQIPVDGGNERVI